MAKRSRRARRQEPAKQPVTPPRPQQEKPSAVAEPVTASVQSKIVNFSQEYFYVYTELRNVLIIAVIMLLLMAGLAYLV